MKVAAPVQFIDLLFSTAGSILIPSINVKTVVFPLKVRVVLVPVIEETLRLIPAASVELIWRLLESLSLSSVI